LRRGKMMGMTRAMIVTRPRIRASPNVTRRDKAARPKTRYRTRVPRRSLMVRKGRATPLLLLLRLPKLLQLHPRRQLLQCRDSTRSTRRN
jgi:hypothetical protein